MLGKDLLKHGAKETTATITEIHNGNSEGNETYLDVYYLNGKVEPHISAERIMDYTATASTTHAVAQEIEKVVITSRIIDSDDRVCFVDTPGLNGIADNHREKTIEEIKNAHACIYLSDAGERTRTKRYRFSEIYFKISEQYYICTKLY